MQFFFPVFCSVVFGRGGGDGAAGPQVVQLLLAAGADPAAADAEFQRTAVAWAVVAPAVPMPLPTRTVSLKKNNSILKLKGLKYFFHFLFIM